MKRITGHVTQRNNKWYGVINLYDADGKRRPKWQSLDLEANGNKNKREAQSHCAYAGYRISSAVVRKSQDKYFGNHLPRIQEYD